MPGIFGTAEGLMARMRCTVAGGVANGYLAWCPAFAGNSGTTSNTYHNVVYFENGSSSANPLNSTADPFGTNYNTSANFVADPAYAFLSGTTAADHRVVSACMIMTYTGSVSSCSGEVALIPNVPTAVLLQGGAGSKPASVDDLFTHAPHYTRVSLEHTELKWHPGARRNAFHAYNTGPIAYTGTASSTQSNSLSQSGDPGWCIIAWRGAPASSLKFTLTKVFEWRPEANIGFPSVVPTTLESETLYTDAVRLLDRGDRDWWRRAGDRAGAMLQGLINGVFAAATPYNTATQGLGRLEL